MAKERKQSPLQLQKSLKKVSELHFLYVLALGLQIVVYDLWNVLTPEVILWRWSLLALFLIVLACVWQIAHDAQKKVRFYQYLAYVLIAADIFVATFYIYTQRGMASRAVILYAVPILAATILRSAKAVYAVAIASILSYVTASVIYFIQTFSEGYKAELVGEVGFYSAILILLASLIIRNKQDQ